jgi:hypothetical protein
VDLPPALAEACRDPVGLGPREVAGRLDAHPPELAGRHGADAVERLDRQRREELPHRARFDDDEPVGFVVVRGDLRRAHRRRDPDARRDAGRLGDARLDVASVPLRERPPVPALPAPAAALGSAARVVPVASVVRVTAHALPRGAVGDVEVGLVDAHRAHGVRTVVEDLSNVLAD